VNKDCRLDVWITSAMAAEIEQLARLEGRAMSAMARRLIEHSLAQVRAALASRPAPRPNGHHQQQHEGQAPWA
jgi:hypothetical protein